MRLAEKLKNGVNLKLVLVCLIYSAARRQSARISFAPYVQLTVDVCAVSGAPLKAFRGYCNYIQTPVVVLMLSIHKCDVLVIFPFLLVSMCKYATGAAIGACGACVTDP